jgi:hypothetical protein
VFFLTLDNTLASVLLNISEGFYLVVLCLQLFKISIISGRFLLILKFLGFSKYLQMRAVLSVLWALSAAPENGSCMVFHV